MNLNFKNIDFGFQINNTDSYQLVIENSKFMYKVVKDLVLLNDDEIFLYDSKSLPLSKNIIVLTNLYDLDPNSKKVLNANYSYVENIKMGTDIINKLIDINLKLQEILSELSFEFNNCVSYNKQLTISGLLNSYEVEFNFDKAKFISTFVTYIRAIAISSNYRVLITINLQDLIDENEFELLNKELNYLNLTLINISSKKSNLNFTKTIIIDKDLCEIC